MFFLQMYIFMNIFLITILSNQKHFLNAELIEVYKWKQLEFFSCGNNFQIKSIPKSNLHDANLVSNLNSNKLKTERLIHFPENTNRQQSFNNRNYSKIASSVLRRESEQDFPCILYNNVPMGVTHYDRRLFITVPRRSEGVPSTLNYIDLGEQTEKSPKLRAYPNFEINQFQDKRNALVSVYRTTADNCGRLWFVDTGILEYTKVIKIQQPSIWIIDLHTDSVIRRVTIPEETTNDGQGLPSITVDTGNGCNLAYAYFPDIYKRYLHVYSFETNSFWSFQHNYFSFDPLASELFVGGQSFSWDDGIFSVTLGPQENDGSRIVFFHAMISNDEFGVSNRVLQDSSKADRSYHGRDFRLLGHRGVKRQSTMHIYDNFTNVVFYAEIQRNGIGCWNADHPLTPDYHGTVATDSRRMIYPSDLTIDQDGFLWMMTNSMPVFVYSKLDTNTYNFRVWKQQTSEAIKGTVCEK